MENKKTNLRAKLHAEKRKIGDPREKENRILSNYFKSPGIMEANRIYEDMRKDFQGNVYNILMTHIHPKKPEYRKYFERAIPGRDWEMFLFEQRSDMQKFRDVLGEKRIRIPMALVPQMNPVLLQSKVDLNQFRSSGIIGSLHDLYDAPDAVKAYLNQTVQLNNLPVSNLREVDTTELSKYFRFVYCPNNVYTFLRSKFQTGICTTTIEQWKKDRVLHVLEEIQAIKNVAESAKKSAKEV